MIEETQLARALDGWPWQELPALPGRTNHRRAGVLLPVRFGADPSVIATVRSSRLRDHPGEVAFPGGRPEVRDATLWDTAAREAAEELGIQAPRRLGRLSSTPLYTSDYRIEPFVGAVDPDAALVPEPGEVAAVLALSLADWLQRSHIDSIPWTWKGVERQSPVFPLGPGVVMYGATAHCFLELLQVVASATGRPLPPRVPGRFQWEDLLPSRSRGQRPGSS